MSKITLTDNILSIIIKMSEGNPGAIVVLSNMMKSPEVFAPADPMMEILCLDTLGVYGSDIWDLGEYVCEGQNMDTLKLILSNHSYGKLSREVLMDHIKNNEPFEKLYTVEELHKDLTKHALPNIEQERHDRLVVEGKYYEKEDDSFSPFAPFDFYKSNTSHKDNFMPKK